MRTQSIIFYRTAWELPYALRGSDSLNTTETERKAFGKFVSLIPEGVRRRLRAIERKIKEVVEK